MPKIKRQLKAASASNLVGAPDSQDSASGGQGKPSLPKLTPAEEIDYMLFNDLFLERVDAVRWWIWSQNKEGETAAAFRLNELLPKELWLRLISYSLLSYFDCDDEECLALLDGASYVVFDWQDDYDEEECTWITVYAEDEFVGYAKYDDFFEGWDGVALRWLVAQLGISPRALRSALDRLMPEQ